MYTYVKDRSIETMVVVLLVTIIAMFAMVAIGHASGNSSKRYKVEHEGKTWLTSKYWCHGERIEFRNDEGMEVLVSMPYSVEELQAGKE